IIRRTFGWKKDSDNISLSQLTTGIRARDGSQRDHGTGLPKSTVALALKSLVAKRILLSHRNSSPERGHEPTTYQLRFKGDPLSNHRTRGSPSVGQALVQPSDTQQTVLQETVEQQHVVVVAAHL